MPRRGLKSWEGAPVSKTDGPKLTDSTGLWGRGERPEGLDLAMTTVRASAPQRSIPSSHSSAQEPPVAPAAQLHWPPSLVSPCSPCVSLVTLHLAAADWCPGPSRFQTCPHLGTLTGAGIPWGAPLHPQPGLIFFPP